MKLLGSTKSKMTKDKSGENVPHFEISELILIQCNTANNDYQQDSRVIFSRELLKYCDCCRTTFILL